MQLICYLKVYNTPLPANAEIYNDAFINILEFKILNPEGIVRLYDPEFVMKDFIIGQNPFDGQEGPADTILTDLFVLMLLVGVFLVLLVVLYIVSKTQTYKIKAIQKLRDIKNNFFFNGIIRSILISYYKLLMASGM